MGIIDLLSNALGAVKEFFGFARQRDAEKNSGSMLQAKEATEEAAAIDKARQAIAEKDLNELRKEASE